MAAKYGEQVPATQIIYLDNIAPEHQLDKPDTEAGKSWKLVLDMIESSAGFRRLYWGRRLEEPEKVQIHTVRDNLSQHKAFLASNTYTNDLLSIIRSLSSPPSPAIRIRHVLLAHQANPHNPLGGSSSLGFPIGTAVYKGANEAWYEGAWPLWTHVVRYVEGCMGISGGRVLEPVVDDEGKSFEDSYLVYVAWESVKHHDDYHHTKHFWKHRIILDKGNEGWQEYGHVVFKGTRGGQGGEGATGNANAKL